MDGILEHAVLNVRAGQGADFERAMGRVRPLIEATPGFRHLELRPCLEAEGRYLLLVWWDSVGAHTEGFCGSARYQDWKAALHPFYTPFPEVQHYGPPL